MPSRFTRHWAAGCKRSIHPSSPGTDGSSSPVQREHEALLALQRLRRNQALTSMDLEELEKMLIQAGGTQALLTELKSSGLGLFIRSLVGLDREAAMQAFSEFLQGGKATPEQIEFIELIVDELTQHGVVPPERLFESPFTDVNAQGPLAVFPPQQVASIVDVLKDIQSKTAAEDKPSGRSHRLCSLQGFRSH